MLCYFVSGTLLAERKPNDPQGFCLTICTMSLVRLCEIKIIGDEIIVSFIFSQSKSKIEELEEESHLQLT
jgi:hypothetical protein